jgi:helix-turn-helix protein
MVQVSYGNYSSEMLELLKENIIKKYEKITVEDNGTIESWHIENNKNNEIVILINKLQNNVVNCSYIFPPLRDESLKIPINEY